MFVSSGFPYMLHSAKASPGSAVLQSVHIQQLVLANYANKGPESQSYHFSSSHIWIWELDHKEGWVPKNWCFQTVVLEKTLESPLDSKEIKLVNSKENQPWILIGSSDAEAEAPILWLPDVKSELISWCWERLQAGVEGVTEDMVGWHHQLSGHDFEWTPGDGEEQGSWHAAVHSVARIRHD